MEINYLNCGTLVLPYIKVEINTVPISLPFKNIIMHGKEVLRMCLTPDRANRQDDNLVAP